MNYVVFDHDDLDKIQFHRAMQCIARLPCVYYTLEDMECFLNRLEVLPESDDRAVRDVIDDLLAGLHNQFPIFNEIDSQMYTALLDAIYCEPRKTLVIIHQWFTNPLRIKNQMKCTPEIEEFLLSDSAWDVNKNTILQFEYL